MIIQENYSLKNLNTFRIDAQAKYFAEVSSVEELKEILTRNDFKNIPKLILGGGSNILLTKDFNGLVISYTDNEIKILSEDSSSVLIEAGAGAVWHDLVLFAIERNLGGIENLSLIPGKVGAAPIQNIGAYGQEIKDTFVSLKAVNINTGELKEFTNNACRFGYRDSIFKRELKGEFIIVSILLKLNKEPELNINYGSVKEELEKLNLEKITVKNVSEVICGIRLSKLPDPKKIGNAGSFFKNPEVSKSKLEELQKKYPDMPSYPAGECKFKIPAGWLIEKAGLKGKREGNVGTHIKQALVLVNYGGAKGEDVLKFKDYIKSEVKRLFNVELEEEVNII